MLDLLSQPVFATTHFSFTVWDVLVIFIIFLGAALLRSTVGFFIGLQTKRKKLRKSQGQTLYQLSGYVIYIAAFFYALHVDGIPLSYFFVGSAALLVGVGLGLQQLFQDVIAGLILLIDPNFNIGDVINNPDQKGKVTHIGIRTTLLQTIDNELVVVPNSKILNTGLHSFANNRSAVRFRISVGVAYGTDVTHARDILIESALSHEACEKEPKPTAILKEFGPHAIQMELRFWMKEIFQYENILSDVRYTIERRFREEGIVIPFQQLTVHLAKNSDES